MIWARGLISIFIVAGVLNFACLSSPDRQIDEIEFHFDAGPLMIEHVKRLSGPSAGLSSRIFGWVAGGTRDRQRFVRPYGVHWNNDLLLVTDPGAGQVFAYRDFRFIASSDVGLLESPIGVVECGGSIYVTDSILGGIAQFDDELHFRSWLRRGLVRPTGIVCDESSLFVAETGSHSIVEIPLQSEESRRVGERGGHEVQFNFPSALAMTGQGNLVVGDTMNFRIQEIDPRNLEQKLVFGQLGDALGDTPRIKGISVDGAGRFWVSDAHLDAVTAFSAHGRVLTGFGGHGGRAGQFSFPAGVAINSAGLLAIADSMNRRVEIFRVVERLQERD